MEWTVTFRRQDKPSRLLPNQIVDAQIIYDYSQDMAKAIEGWLEQPWPVPDKERP